jgi:hypothetical protein
VNDLDALFGIPVVVIRPGDRFHPGDDKTYLVSIPAMREAMKPRDLWREPEVKFAWKVRPSR